MTWGYQERRDVINNSKKAAAGVDSNQRELRALRDEVTSLRDEQRQLVRANRQLLEAFNRLQAEMQKMREDMYPTSKTTKSVLRRPQAGAAGAEKKTPPAQKP